MKLLVLFLVFLSGCITVIDLPKRKGKIDVSAKPYVKAFYKEYSKHFKRGSHQTSRLEHRLSTLVVEFSVLSFIVGNESRIIGTCHFDGYGLPVIRLDLGFWADADEIKKEWLIFHELGHCVLGQDHRDYFVDFEGVKLKGSIMDSSIGEGREYLKYRPYYMQELFTAKEGIHGKCNLTKE